MVPPHMVVAKTKELASMREKIEGALPRESASSGEVRGSRGKGHAKGKDFFKGKSKGKDFKGKSKGKDSSDESSEGSANPPPHKRGKRDEPGNAAGEDSSDEPVMSAAEAAGGHKKDKKDKKDHKAKAKKDTVVDRCHQNDKGDKEIVPVENPRAPPRLNKSTREATNISLNHLNEQACLRIQRRDQAAREAKGGQVAPQSSIENENTKGLPGVQYVLVRIPHGESRQLVFADAGCIGVMNRYMRNLDTMRSIMKEEPPAAAGGSSSNAEAENLSFAALAALMSQNPLDAKMEDGSLNHAASEGVEVRTPLASRSW